MDDFSPNVLSKEKKFRPNVRSGNGFPSGVCCVIELYLRNTFHTRLFDVDSLVLSGLIRIATVVCMIFCFSVD